MPRLNHIDPSNATGKAKELFDGPLAKMQLNIFKGMANSPDTLMAYLGFSKAVKGAGSLTGADHEVIALTTGQLNGCEYCMAAHTKSANAVGIDAETALNIRKGQPKDPKHAAMTKFVTAIIEKNGHVSDQQLQSFKDAGYTDAAVVETIASIAINYFTNYFNHVHETQIDPIFTPAPKI